MCTSVWNPFFKNAVFLDDFSVNAKKVDIF